MDSPRSFSPRSISMGLVSIGFVFNAAWLVVLLVIVGCGEPEYQPPKDAIPDIPPGRSDSMNDLGPPKK